MGRRPPPGKRRLNVVVDEELYLELVRRYGVRNLSSGVEELLRAALAAPPAGRRLPPQPEVEVEEVGWADAPEWVKGNPWLAVLRSRATA